MALCFWPIFNEVMPICSLTCQYNGLVRSQNAAHSWTGPIDRGWYMPENDPKTGNRVCCRYSQLISKCNSVNNNVSLPETPKEIRVSSFLWASNRNSSWFSSKYEPNWSYQQSWVVYLAGFCIRNNRPGAQVLEEIADALALANIELQQYHSGCRCLYTHPRNNIQYSHWTWSESGVCAKGFHG